VAEANDRPDRWKASWEEHRRQQRTLGVAATPAQRLAWLEEMIVLAHRTGALPRKPQAEYLSAD
jgi:hypothetical protein